MRRSVGSHGPPSAHPSATRHVRFLGDWQALWSTHPAPVTPYTPPVVAQQT